MLPTQKLAPPFRVWKPLVKLKRTNAGYSSLWMCPLTLAGYFDVCITLVTLTKKQKLM